jgi:hypothetical protein
MELLVSLAQQERPLQEAVLDGQVNRRLAEIVLLSPGVDDPAVVGLHQTQRVQVFAADRGSSWPDLGSCPRLVRMSTSAEESFPTTSSFCHRGQVSPHGREAEGGGAEQLALLLVGRDPVDGGVHVRPQGQFDSQSEVDAYCIS